MEKIVIIATIILIMGECYKNKKEKINHSIIYILIVSTSILKIGIMW
jgi:hypothetical protein